MIDITDEFGHKCNLVIFSGLHETCFQAWNSAEKSTVYFVFTPLPNEHKMRRIHKEDTTQYSLHSKIFIVRFSKFSCP